MPEADRPTDRDLAELFDAASVAAMLVGDASWAAPTPARTRRSRLVDDTAAGPDDDRVRRAKARERLGYASWLAGDTPQRRSACSRRPSSCSAEHTAVDQIRRGCLPGLAANLMLAGRSRESVPFAERAIETARATGDTAIESRAMNVLGVDRATLGDIAGGIDLLRRSLATVDPADDATAVPRAYANLGSVLEMGGYVDEALEVSLAGAESIRRYGNELSFRTFLEVNAAAMLIELGRYPEAVELLERNLPRVLPGLSTVHLHVTLAHLTLRTGDLAAARRSLDIAGSEATRIADAQFVIDLHSFGTEIALWDGAIPRRSEDRRAEEFDRLLGMDAAVIVGQLAIPAVHAAADMARSGTRGSGSGRG